MFLPLLFSIFSLAADKASPVRLPLQMDLFDESTLAKVCAKNLNPKPEDIPWKGSLNELMNVDESDFFAKISARVNPMVLSRTNRDRNNGFEFSLDQRGFIKIQRMSGTGPHTSYKIPLIEPIASMEFFPTDAKNGFFVVVGWTRVGYYQASGDQITNSTEDAFQKALPNAVPAGLIDTQLKIKAVAYDDYVLTTTAMNGKAEVPNTARTLFLNFKQLKNLVEPLHLDSKKLDGYVFRFFSHFRNPRRHPFEVYMETQKILGDPPTVASIFTAAVVAISQLRDPDFSSHFSPLVEEALSAAFRTENLRKFMMHFSHFVATLSKEDLGLNEVSLGYSPPSDDGDAIARYQDKTGKQYILYYSYSPRWPLKIVRVP